MATFRATFAPKAQTYSVGSTLPAMLGSDATGLSELTTSGTAGNVQSGGSDFEAPSDGFVTMMCDGAVWVSISADPTAAVGTDWYLKADERMDLAIRKDHKISVIDDS